MINLKELTQKEYEFSQEHHETALRFLRLRGLPEDEFYDVIIFGYLKAVQEYLRKPELRRRYCFSTIAERQMRDALFEEFQYQNRAKRKAPTVSYEDDPVAGLDAFLPRRSAAIEEMLHDQEILTDLLSYLTPKEKEVVRLKADGYTYREIAEACHISVYGVRSRFSRFRERLLTVHVTPGRRDTV